MESHLKELLFISDGGHVIRDYMTFINAAKCHKDVYSTLIKYKIPEDILKTVNFKYVNVENIGHVGAGVADNLIALERLQPEMPMMVMEFWAGWFDYWGQSRNPLDNQLFKHHLGLILDRDASVNFYMFHGGTNFGFNSGAITLETGFYTADVTSYDYDCPITENGEPNTKFEIIKSAIEKKTGKKVKETIPKNIPSSSYPSLEKSQWEKQTPSSIWAEKEFRNIFESFELDKPVPMELINTKNGHGQPYGYILYETTYTVIEDNRQLRITDLQK